MPELRCWQVGKRAVPYVVPCSICGVVSEVPAAKRQYYKKAGRYVCSETCWRESYAVREHSGPREEGRKRLSESMRARNPMHRLDVRERVSQTLRDIGHQPPVRGGNGRGPTEPQRLLAEALGWPMEHIVPTGQKGNGIPTHFKLDIADPASMVAVEVDGLSHGAVERQKQDARKESFLRGRGWTVLRFSNQEVMADTEGCARTVMSTTSRLRARTPTS